MLEFYMRKMPNIDFQEADLSIKKKKRINFVIK